MTHPAREQLFAYVHGWDPRPDHLDACGPCRETVGAFRDELDLLRRAEARVAPKTGARRLGWFLPLGVAAAALLGTVALIAVRGPLGDDAHPARQAQAPTDRELGRTFLNGTDAEAEGARRALLERGTAALLELTELRRRSPEARRVEGLASLIFDIKRAAAGEAGKAALDLVESIRISVDLQNAPVSAAADYLREISGLNLMIDPLYDAGTNVTLKVDNVPFRAMLGLLGDRAGLDYDFRYGVLFLAPTDRLWSAPKAEPVTPLTLDQAKDARALVRHFSSESFEEREAAAAKLRRMGAAVLPVLEEGTREKDAEVAARCRGLIEDLRPRPAQTPFPRAARWRSQKVEEASQAVARKLDTMKIDLAFENTALADVLSFIRDFGALNVVVEGETVSPSLTLKVKNLTLGQVLELIYLPLGLDIRLDQGVVTVFKPKKPF